MAREHLSAFRHVSHALRRRADAVFAPLGLGAADYEVLTLLWRSDALEQRELARALRVTRATAHAAVMSLQRRGLLALRPSSRDGRVQVLQLTPAGRALEAPAHAAWAVLDRSMLRGFTAGDRARLLALLERLADALDAGDHAPVFPDR